MKTLRRRQENEKFSPMQVAQFPDLTALLSRRCPKNLEEMDKILKLLGGDHALESIIHGGTLVGMIDVSGTRDGAKMWLPTSVPLWDVYCIGCHEVGHLCYTPGGLADALSRSAKKNNISPPWLFHRWVNMLEDPRVNFQMANHFWGVSPLYASYYLHSETQWSVEEIIGSADDLQHFGVPNIVQQKIQEWLKQRFILTVGRAALTDALDWLLGARCEELLENYHPKVQEMVRKYRKQIRELTKMHAGSRILCREYTDLFLEMFGPQEEVEIELPKPPPGEPGKGTPTEEEPDETAPTSELSKILSGSGPSKKKEEPQGIGLTEEQMPAADEKIKELLDNETAHELAEENGTVLYSGNAGDAVTRAVEEDLNSVSRAKSFQRQAVEDDFKTNQSVIYAGRELKIKPVTIGGEYGQETYSALLSLEKGVENDECDF